MKFLGVKEHRHLKLFWKIYFYGLLLLFCVAITAAVATHFNKFIGPTPPVHNPQRILTAIIAAQLSQPQSNPETLHRMLQNLNEKTGFSISVFNVDGKLLAHTGSLALLKIETADIPERESHRFFIQNGSAHLILPLFEGGSALGSIIVSWKGKGHIRLAVTLAAILVMLTVLPYFSARAIARPLNKVMRTTQAIGEGKLGARTGIQRSDEIGQLATEVDRMAGRIEQLIRSEKALMANISHEIRTPLTRIRILLEMLSEAEGGSGVFKDHLMELNDDVIELETLLEDVFLSARLELNLGASLEGSLQLKRESLDICGPLERSIQKIQMLGTGHQFEVKAAGIIPKIIGDRNLLQRVFQNILLNAVKYSSPGTIVEIAVQCSDSGVKVQFRDHGPGIPEGELDKIFQPFFRSGISGFKPEGKGIGLALCKHIMNSHNGSIRAENRVEGGAVFTVKFNEIAQSS